MKQTFTLSLLGSLILASTAWAQAQEAERQVGPDGVPVITIRGEAPDSYSPDEDVIEEIPNRPRKAFRVYELDGEQTNSSEQTKIIVVSSPPPVAPNPGAFNGYGNGYGYGYGFQPNIGFYGPNNFVRQPRNFRRNQRRGYRLNTVNNFQFQNRSNFYTPRSTFQSTTRGNFRGRNFNCR